MTKRGFRQPSNSKLQKQMFLKKIVILPILLFAFLAISSLIEGALFFFFLWLFISLFLLISLYPLVVEMKETTAPVFHIFASMILFPLFLSTTAFFDFKQAGFPLSQSVLYGVAIGAILTAFMMLVKGK